MPRAKEKIIFRLELVTVSGEMQEYWEDLERPFENTNHGLTQKENNAEDACAMDKVLNRVAEWGKVNVLFQTRMQML